MYPKETIQRRTAINGFEKESSIAASIASIIENQVIRLHIEGDSDDDSAGDLLSTTINITNSENVIVIKKADGTAYQVSVRRA